MIVGKGPKGGAVRKLSTRIEDNWLVLTHLDGSTWRLQVWGDTPLEAEVIAVDETEAKRSAVAATIERLNIERSPRHAAALLNWNAVITSRWDSRL
jgi:hypothetical protein